MINVKLYKRESEAPPAEIVEFLTRNDAILRPFTPFLCNFLPFPFPFFIFNVVSIAPSSPMLSDKQFLFEVDQGEGEGSQRVQSNGA